MKKILLAFFLTLFVVVLKAQQKIYVCQGINYSSYDISVLGDMTFGGDGTTLSILGTVYDVSQIDSITFAEPKFDMGAKVIVTYNGAAANIVISSSLSGVTYTLDGADVVITSTNTSDDISYVLQGSSTDGSLTYIGDYKCGFTFNNLSLTSEKKGAIDIQCGKRVAMVLPQNTESSVADASSGSQKAAIYCKGHMEFEGAGTLNVKGNYKHAISSKEYVQLKKSTGTINITHSANDGIHAGQYFQMNGGVLNISGTAGDCIQAETTSDPTDESNGQMIIKGGTINLSLAAEDVKALKADSLITISGGAITIGVTGAGSKAISTKGDLVINENNAATSININTTASTYLGDSTDPKYGDGINIDGDMTITAGTIEITNSGDESRGIKLEGTLYIEGGIASLTASGDASKCIRSKYFEMVAGELTITTSGAPIVTDYDPSYCSGIKTETFSLNSGTIIMNCSGIANKGISINGVGTIDGGTVNITTTGNGGYYKLASGYDTFAATAIKCDGELLILAGDVTLKSTGTGGKGINCDQTIVIGREDNSGPTMTVATTGAQYTYSNQSSKSKAIKALGKITINGGSMNISTAKAEAEGIESKTSIDVNGGDLVIVAYDDGINSDGPITFNGGRCYVQSTGNDAIDSNYGKNGAIIINGGILIAVGVKSPEEALDCDNHAWIQFNGGTVFTMGGQQGGASSTPVCGQGTIFLQNVSLNANQYLTVTQGGVNVYTVKIPTTLSQSYCFLSDSKLTGSCIITTGTVAPGAYTSEWQGLYQEADITTGTAVSTVTLSNNYGTNGSSGGGGRPK